jgi:3-hydroxy-9,10-secoandrosta-1,3,5(10)-triene-9,17-dione monooxygenase reductase component
MTTSPAPIDPRELRNALGRFTTGVTVITTCTGDGRPVGLTANSFSAASLEPPLVAWSLAARSGSLAAFRTARYFAVNVLAADQEPVGHRFIGPPPERFVGIDWTPGLEGIPLLGGCLARFECRTTHRMQAGDHWLFLGAVERFAYGTGAPLVFFASRYGLPPVDHRDGAGSAALAAQAREAA